MQNIEFDFMDILDKYDTDHHYTLEDALRDLKKALKDRCVEFDFYNGSMEDNWAGLSIYEFLFNRDIAFKDWTAELKKVEDKKCKT